MEREYEENIMNVTKMKKKDFESVPVRSTISAEVPAFYSLVIIPTNKFHSSGFKIMKFVVCDSQGEPMFMIHGCTDSIHINGIGGSCSNNPPGRQTPWMIDCLPCGYLRLFSDKPVTCGMAVSDFEVFLP